MAKGHINYTNPPETLGTHPFFGFQLDDEQKAFRDAIWDREKLIIFANSCAGTGKTLVATATAELLVKYGLYDGIVYIAAPVQEAKVGFLPGNADEKSEPYFEPFYQALDKIGVNLKTCFADDIINQKNGTAYIQCLTHTFLRGCTFSEKVVIIDEAQNFYIDELKKVLTRMTDTCKVIVIGHTGQCDLYHSPERSGFRRYISHFYGDPRAAVCTLTQNHRGWIAQHADNLR